MFEQRQKPSILSKPAVSLAERMVLSDSFKLLFSQGMTLVEETAAYLDGPGRQESKALPRLMALAYASESMRLTTRLMQVTSWLLLQRAVNEGELSRSEAEREHRKVKIGAKDIASPRETVDELPAALRALITRSLRLQERIGMIDAQLKADQPAGTPAVNPVAAQIASLAAALQPGA